jgi:hypothetical protein
MQPRSNLQNIYDTLYELSAHEYIKYITLMKDVIVSSAPPQHVGATLFDFYSYINNDLLGRYHSCKEEICSAFIILFAPELLAASDFDLLKKFLEIEKDTTIRSEIAHAMVSSIHSFEDLLIIVKKLDSDKKYSLIETHKRYFDQLRRENSHTIATAPSLATVSTSAFATFQGDVGVPAATGNEIARDYTKPPH